MYVIEVIPLVRGVGVESLTYYSSQAYSPGDVISVPVRNSTIRALVSKNEAVSAAKTAVRAATFSLKKLPPQTDTQCLPQLLIDTAYKLKDHYPAQLGALFFALLPPEVREGTQDLNDTRQPNGTSIPSEIALLQAPLTERFIEYRSKIREVFAHRGSVLFVVPTAADIAPAAALLTQGIDERVIIFSPQLTKKRLSAAYQAFNDFTNAKLIITTPLHAYLDRHDITHVIVEQARSQQYRTKSRPFLDHREALKTMTHLAGASLTLGDLLPLSEDEEARRQERYITYGEHPKRISLPAKLEVIYEPPTEQQTTFSLFSKKVSRTLVRNYQDRARTFIFAARRGIAPLVICIDCGHIFRDPSSGAPYSLFRTNTNGQEERWFISSTSGKRIRAADTCEACGSWRLRERGVGIQHIESELKEQFPDIPVFLFDQKSASTPRRADQIISDFYDCKGAILLGTQKVISYLTKPVDTTIVSSHDAARTIPTWRADEEFFALLLTLRERTSTTVYVQTRTEPDTLLTLAAQGAVEEFYNEEIELRSDLQYPPFSTFILLTWQDHRGNITKTEAMIKSTLENFKIRCYSGPDSTVAKTKRHCLIRIPAAEWPNPRLLELLRSLPPYIRVELNPHRIV